MQLIQVLLVGLAGSASAIDIFFNCGGGTATTGCRGINPDRCCDGTRIDAIFEIGFYGIPNGWNLQCRGHWNGNCNQFKNSQNSNGANFVCLRNGGYSGAGYGFVGRKRDVIGEAGATDAECVKPNTIRFEDGVMYDIEGLADVEVDKIMEAVNIGGNSSSVPAEFAILKIVE